MDTTTTLISNLPNDTIQQNISISQSDNSNHYQPMNVHPNPYGISEQNPLANPEHTKQTNKKVNYQEPMMNQQLTHEQIIQLQQQQPQHLPSRDIPQDPTVYSNDEEVQPNYVPKPKKHVDFVSEEEIMTERNLREYEARLKKENKMDMLLTEIQIPFFIAILYFIFQLPVINSLLLKYFSFLAIYDVDGNFNLIGLILKSILFGNVYYMFNQAINFLSDI
tara:strand:- start:396 stop:1058 length:663 start_codon:yes stop_codon:yes gene_type:complete